MEDISDISSRPLQSLSLGTRTLLSSLLNSTKVLPFQGRSRDWRGLAALTGVSAEEEANIWGYNDKFGKVLEMWMSSQSGTVGELLKHLTTLDRFDVYEDVVESIRQQMQIRPDNQVALQNNNHLKNNVNEEDDLEMITFEDRPGYQHRYHAYILSADEDYEFTSELRSRLTAQGFELCSKENLLPGYASQFPPVAKLIAERCQRVILVYSPHFLTCRDNSFLRDYTQAISIQQSSRSMVPILYRECALPAHLRLYTMLRYGSAMGNFWERLVHALDATRHNPSITGAPPRPLALPAADTGSSRAHSVSIETLPASGPVSDDRRYFLPPPARPRSTTPSLLLPDSPSTLPHSNSSVSLVQSVSGQLTMDPLLPKKKKSGKIKKFLVKVIKGGN